VSGRLTFAYRLALGRPPTADEQHECASFLQEYHSRLIALQTPADQLQLRTWSAFARALLSANELVFID
jgi:hypothetical protein